jgi:hypothetical protein
MLADVDNFKRVNDGHGHHAGDLVLAELAQVMAHAMRELDVLARWGGEEFMALLPSTDAVMARQVAERVRAAAAAHVVEVDGRRLVMTPSFGLADIDDGDLQAAPLGPLRRERRQPGATRKLPDGGEPPLPAQERWQQTPTRPPRAGPAGKRRASRSPGPRPPDPSSRPSWP